jgi:hypothetical protein
MLSPEWLEYSKVGALVLLFQALVNKKWVSLKRIPAGFPSKSVIVSIYFTLACKIEKGIRVWVPSVFAFQE